jgi:hypothetical protein
VVVDCRERERKALEAVRNAKALKRKRQKGGSVGENCSTVIV